jgi:hypothetical protein
MILWESTGLLISSRIPQTIYRTCNPKPQQNIDKEILSFSQPKNRKRWPTIREFF